MCYNAIIKGPNQCEARRHRCGDQGVNGGGEREECPLHSQLGVCDSDVCTQRGSGFCPRRKRVLVQYGRQQHQLQPISRVLTSNCHNQIVAIPASNLANTPAEGNQRFHLRTESLWIPVTKPGRTPPITPTWAFKVRLCASCSSTSRGCQQQNVTS